MITPIQLAPKVQEHTAQLRACKSHREVVETFDYKLAYEIVSTFGEYTGSEGCKILIAILKLRDIRLTTIDLLLDIYAVILQIDRLAEEYAEGILNG